LTAGCAIQQTEVVTPSFDQQLQQPRADYSNGSIWQSTSITLTEDSKARRLGDIVTVVIVETASASKEAATATGRSSELNAGIPNFWDLRSQRLSAATFLI